MSYLGVKTHVKITAHDSSFFVGFSVFYRDYLKNAMNGRGFGRCAVCILVGRKVRTTHLFYNKIINLIISQGRIAIYSLPIYTKTLSINNT
ncbi:hypothetical protein [Moraxella lacunata]|uniref:hypothetical protein n=1 Tax=Moraxella lacunata TaxID=477 RepID=UPI003EE239F3